MFAACMSEPEENEKALPQPPPPPPRRDSKGNWFPGKYLGHLGSVAREKIDELPSLSSHGFSSHGQSEARRVSAQEVAMLFPNTTKAIAKERDLRPSDKEKNQIEKWWLAQLFAEAGLDDDEHKNMLAKGKPPKTQPLPSDARWAFEARIMHPACSGILRIVLHFVTEFLSNDVVNVVTRGKLGQWTLPTLIQAFIRQIENILAEHPLWRSEYAIYTPNDEGGRPLTTNQEHQLRAQDAAWETSCDELENFIFRKIGAVLLPSKGLVTKAADEGVAQDPSPSHGPMRGGYGGTGSRSEKSTVVFDRLSSMGWVTSSDLGVEWGGLDNASMWAPAGKELNKLSSCQAPLEMLNCLVKCFAHVSNTLVRLLEESSKQEKLLKAKKREGQSVSSTIRKVLLTASSMNESLNQERLSMTSDIPMPDWRSNDTEDGSGLQLEGLQLDSAGGGGMRSSLTSSRWSLDSKDVGSGVFANLPCADDILPAVILVLLQSNPRHILAYLDFALAFRNQQRLSSEGHYFIVTLTSAVHFLLDIQPDQLGLTAEEFERRSSIAATKSIGDSVHDEERGVIDVGIPEQLFKIDGIVEEVEDTVHEKPTA